jgi:hypothetical protein
MNPALETLRDIVLPDPASWAPQTIGWWVLLALLIIAGVAAGIAMRRRRRANWYRRWALAELDRIEVALSDPAARTQALVELPALVKRTALAAFPRHTVASLSADSWLRFLDESYGGNGFTAGPGRLLPALAYTGGDFTGESLGELAALVREWIRRHRVRV